jgi:hypothetical protein
MMTVDADLSRLELVVGVGNSFIWEVGDLGLWEIGDE